MIHNTILIFHAKEGHLIMKVMRFVMRGLHCKSMLHRVVQTIAVLSDLMQVMPPYLHIALEMKKLPIGQVTIGPVR